MKVNGHEIGKMGRGLSLDREGWGPFQCLKFHGGRVHTFQHTSETGALLVRFDDGVEIEVNGIEAARAEIDKRNGWGYPTPIQKLTQHRRAIETNRGTTLCRWFITCENDATATRPHPVLGDVPICARCDAKAAAHGA